MRVLRPCRVAAHKHDSLRREAEHAPSAAVAGASIKVRLGFGCEAVFPRSGPQIKEARRSGPLLLRVVV